MCKYIKIYIYIYIYLKNISKNIHNITQYVTKNVKNTNPYDVCDCLPIIINNYLLIIAIPDSALLYCIVYTLNKF